MLYIYMLSVKQSLFHVLYFMYSPSVMRSNMCYSLAGKDTQLLKLQMCNLNKKDSQQATLEKLTKKLSHLFQCHLIIWSIAPSIYPSIHSSKLVRINSGHVASHPSLTQAHHVKVSNQHNVHVDAAPLSRPPLCMISTNYCLPCKILRKTSKTDKMPIKCPTTDGRKPGFSC